MWRESRKKVHGVRKQPPVGTTFSFTLNTAAAVKLAFTQTVTGRRVAGSCVRQTKHNKHKRSCKLTNLVGTFALTGRAGTNKLAFGGTLPNRHNLDRHLPGRDQRQQQRRQDELETARVQDRVIAAAPSPVNTPSVLVRPPGRARTLWISRVFTGTLRERRRNQCVARLGPCHDRRARPFQSRVPRRPVSTMLSPTVFPRTTLGRRPSGTEVIRRTSVELVYSSWVPTAGASAPRHGAIAIDEQRSPDRSHSLDYPYRVWKRSTNVAKPAGHGAADEALLLAVLRQAPLRKEVRPRVGMDVGGCGALPSRPSEEVGDARSREGTVRVGPTAAERHNRLRCRARTPCACWASVGVVDVVACRLPSPYPPHTTRSLWAARGR